MIHFRFDTNRAILNLKQMEIFCIFPKLRLFKYDTKRYLLDFTPMKNF